MVLALSRAVAQILAPNYQVIVVRTSYPVHLSLAVSRNVTTTHSTPASSIITTVHHIHGPPHVDTATQ